MIQKLGKYSIVEKLGEGAMGAVYKAYDEILDRYVAIKTMAEDIKWDPELKLRFYREARSAAGLHHPNIVTIHDLGEEGKITYIVMEFLQGKDLKDIIREKPPLALEKKLAIIAQVCEGLNHAHLAGIIHRDIKPGNIHFSADGNVKIVDFGIARIPASDLTRSGVRLGTPIYMSPEQIRGEAYDERSDMFSTGIVFYELVTYVHPFRDKNIAKTLDNLLFQNHFPFAEQCPEAPPALWPIISTSLAKEPAKRFPSMAEMGRACRGLLVEMNAASRKMMSDLSAVAPRLLQAASRPGAPPRLGSLLQETQTALGMREPPDHATLKRLLDSLAEERVPVQQVEVSSVSREGRIPDASPLPPEAPPPAVVAPPPDPDDVRGRDLLHAGQALLQEERLDEALTILHQAVRLLGENQELAQALAEANRRTAERKQVQIAALVDRARLALASRQYTSAIEALNEVLQQEPGHAEAAELRHQAVAEAEAEREQQARQAEGEREKASGLKLLSEGKFPESITALRRAADLLGSNPEIERALREAGEKDKAEQQRRLVQAKLGEAVAQLRSKAFDQAETSARQVLEIFPGNVEAEDLLSRIDRARQQERRAAEISNLLAQSREQLDHQDFEAAQARTREIMALDPANADAQSLLQAIAEARETKRKQEAIEAAISEGQKAFLRDEVEEAEKFARLALDADPQHGKALELMRRITEIRDRKKREEIAAIVARGRQALVQGDLQEAASLGQQALQADPESIEARNFLASLRQAEESRRQEKLAAFLAGSRQALESGDFAEATRQAEALQHLDARNREAASLLKDINNARRKKEKADDKERKRLEKESRRLAQATADTAPETVDGAIPAETTPRRGLPKAVIWASAGALLLIIAAVLAWQLPRLRSNPPEPAAQLAAAQTQLDRGLFDEAIAAAREVLATSPNNAQAQTLIEVAQKQKIAKEVAMLLMEAQTLRSQGSLQESLDTLAKLISLDPANETALLVQAQIEGEIAAGKSSAEQEALVKEWLANAARFLGEGKQAEAKRALDNVAGLRPDAPELRPLRNKLKALTDEAARAEKGRIDLAQKQKQVDEWNSQAGEKFKQGRYGEALTILEQWLSAAPQNAQAQDLQRQASLAQQSQRAYDTHMAQRNYDEALRAAAQLEKINPADPSVAELRKRAEARKAAAKATLSIYRLGEPASLFLDDEPLGTAGELEDRVVSAGRHKVTVQVSSGKQSTWTADLSEGQKVILAYDAAALSLRPMVDADRELLSMRKIREEVHSFEVEHRHGILGITKCTGILKISGLRVEFRSPDHALDTTFANVRLKNANNDRIELETVDTKQSWSFKMRDAAQAKAVKELWDRLTKLGK